MHAGSEARSSHAVPRRVVTRTAAWSVPAVSVALAAPALAASTTDAIDLAITTQPFGDGVAGYSPDMLQMYDMTIPGGFDATNLGALAAPQGSTVTLSFDSRLFSGATLEADGTEVTPLSSRSAAAAGNLTTISFRLPMEIPAGATISLRPSLDRVDPSPWATDIEPYTVAITPATGSDDAVAGNNSLAMEARYYETHDATLSATWRQHELTTAGGDPLLIDVQDTVTITANAPGDVPADGSLTIGGPSTYDGSEYVDVFEDVTITSALLDGQDVSDQFELRPSSGIDDRREWWIHVAIPEGKSLVVDVDVQVATSTREYVYSGAWTQFYAYRDRDGENDRADAPPFP